MKIEGINIRKLREGKGLSLRKFAKKLNVSGSLISQIETGKVSPSLSTLKKIANALNTTVSLLIGEEKKYSESPVLKFEERKNIKNIGTGISMHLLTSSDPNKQMEPYIFEFNENAHTGKSLYKHFGQEFILILKGSIEVTLNKKTYLLKKGDTLYFNSHIPHYFKNVYNGKSEGLWVISPPSF